MTEGGDNGDHLFSDTGVPSLVAQELRAGEPQKPENALGVLPLQRRPDCPLGGVDGEVPNPDVVNFEII